jgi:hypothetical protein
MAIKTGKILKNILKAIGILLFVIILAAIAIPYFFKDEILEEVKKVANENVRAKIDFSDVGISMFSSFPDVTVSLEDLKVDGIEVFKGVRLADIKEFEVDLDIMSVINGEMMKINSVSLNEPTLYVKVLKNGLANYDIAIPSEELDTMQSEPTKFEIALSEYSVNNGNIIYDDASADTWVEIKNLNHKGTGNFTEAIYDLDTKTTADAFTASSGGISYLSKVKTDIDMEINIDMNNAKYTFKENEVNLNALQLNFDGFVAMPTDDIEMDLKFSSPQTSFKSILSMIPAAFSKDFDEVKASGKMGLNGVVKGIFNDNSMPALDIDLMVANGTFKYPDLPLGMSNINVKTNIKSPSADFDKLVVDVPQFHIELDGNPFDANLKLRTPMSNPDVQAKMKGTIDLAKLAQAFPMEGIKTLSGIINADISTNMKMNDVTNENYENIDLSGKMAITDINYIAEGTPAVLIQAAQMDFTPQNIQLNNFEAKLGKSDIKLSGFVENPLTYFSGEKVMNGEFVMRSNLLDINEFMVGEEPSKVQNPDADAVSVETAETEMFDAFAFKLDGEIGELIYDVYRIKNMKAKGSFTPERFDLENFMMNLGNTDLQVNGQLNNVFGYVFDGETIKGNIDMKADVLDLNEIMAMGSSSESENKNESTETTTTTTTAEPEGDIFGRFDVVMKADAKQILYDVYDIKNLKAEGRFTQNEFDIKSFETKIGKSDMKGSGTVSNALNYVFKSNETVSGRLIMNSNYLDLNELMAMGTSPETTTETPTETQPTAENVEMEPAVIPSDMNFDIQADFGKVLYDNIVLDQMKGEILLKDSKVSMNEVRANTLGGSMVLNGAYNTQDPKTPKFEFAYDIKQFEFDESVKQLRSFKYILPIAEYLQGRFNSQLSLTGELGTDMLPKWSTLNAKGIVETLQTAVKGNPTLDKIVTKLNASEMNPFKLEDTKNIITIVNGNLSIQPFSFNYKDVMFTVGGSHGIGGDLDYTIKTKIPRAMLDKNGATAALNTGLDLLSGQASKLGINLAQGEYIDVDILLSGPVKDPKYKFKLVGTEGKTDALKDAAKQKLEQEAGKLKEKAQAEIDKQKAELEAKANAEADKLKKQAEAKAKAELDKIKQQTEAKAKAEIERLQKEAAAKLKKELGDKASELAKQKSDSIQAEIKRRIDEDTRKKLEEEKKKLQDKLDKYNPFKKKKGGGK